MKILAIGTDPLDLQTNCAGMFEKFINSGHSVTLIIADNKKQPRLSNTIKELYKNSGISKVHFVTNFDFSKVTQNNVNLINSIIDKINPSIAVIPSIKSCDKKKIVLAKSSILACRKIKNILIYKTGKKETFSPDVFFIPSTNSLQNKILSSHQKKNISKKNFGKTSNPAHVLYRFNSTDKGIESFESHRMVLLENDLF
ncbi:MAG TPA: hypothetical protein VFG24_02080 [Nitrosopumilaceae archaeon]|nr:hypothetical protein [Nitrosopumilaceae archaeon]